MFDGQRGFRAVVFSSSLRTVDEVIALFPKDSFAEELCSVGEVSPAFTIHHGFYLSPVAYLPPESLSEIRVQRGETEMYKYDFYICRWQRTRKTVFIFAVPFSKMAVDVFSVLHEKSRLKKRVYKKINLQTLMEKLSTEAAPVDEIVASSVRFRVAGSDTVKTAYLSGSDVFSSEYYRRTTKSLKGIRLVPRRVRLRYGRDPKAFALEADSHGNYWFHAKKGGVNIAQLQLMLGALEQADLIEDTPHYPLRPGIRKEEEDDCQ